MQQRFEHSAQRFNKAMFAAPGFSFVMAWDIQPVDSGSKILRQSSDLRLQRAACRNGAGHPRPFALAQNAIV
jgi:hypothetical protein